MEEKVCCFFGHRKITLANGLREKLIEVIKKLITEEKIQTFLFGSRSEFDTLCYQVVSEFKKEYPNIKRVYVRAEFPYIDQSYCSYLLESYEETYYPEHMIQAGRASYVERNREMIEKSLCCVVYFNENYMPPKRKQRKEAWSVYQPKSGTNLAYQYAMQKKRKIINLFENLDAVYDRDL